MDSTTVMYTTCEKLDKMGNLTGVWLTLSTKDGSIINFESNFKNINLIKKSDGKTIHPFAILWPDEYNSNGKKNLQYLTSALKTTKFESKFSFQKKIDLLLIFTGAENGDKLIIDNFVEAVIQ